MINPTDCEAEDTYIFSDWLRVEGKLTKKWQCNPINRSAVKWCVNEIQPFPTGTKVLVRKKQRLVSASKG